MREGQAHGLARDGTVGGRGAAPRAVTQPSRQPQAFYGQQSRGPSARAGMTTDNLCSLGLARKKTASDRPAAQATRPRRRPAYLGYPRSAEQAQLTDQRPRPGWGKHAKTGRQTVRLPTP